MKNTPPHSHIHTFLVKWACQVKHTDLNLSFNVQIQAGKRLNITPSESFLAFLKADLPSTELGEVTILPLLLLTIWKVSGPITHKQSQPHRNIVSYILGT
jgi:hypothetical protein